MWSILVTGLRPDLYVVILVHLKDLLLSCVFPLHQRVPEIPLELSDTHPQLHLLPCLLVLEQILDGGADDRLLVVGDDFLDVLVEVSHLEVADVEPADVISVVLVHQVHHHPVGLREGGELTS